MAVKAEVLVVISGGIQVQRGDGGFYIFDESDRVFVSHEEAPGIGRALTDWPTIAAEEDLMGRRP